MVIVMKILPIDTVITDINSNDDGITKLNDNSVPLKVNMNISSELTNHGHHSSF